jgi:hypothetical protein
MRCLSLLAMPALFFRPTLDTIPIFIPPYSLTLT